MNITPKTAPMVELSTDSGHILHRIGSDDYTEMRRVRVPQSEADQWEELAPEQVPAYSKAAYDAEVERLIARRYTTGQEIQLNRERTERPAAFEAYMAYVAECKAEAKARLSAGVGEGEETTGDD